MKNQLVLVVGLAAVIILLMYMFFFQVPYDEVAVVTTFGKADPPQYVDGRIDPNNSGSLRIEPGLYFRLPTPIQNVDTYSRKLQIFDTPLQEVRTRDQRNVAVSSYVVWRIEDPLRFWTAIEYITVAENTMRSQMKDALGSIIGTEYRLDQLVNTDENRLKLTEIEDKLRERLISFVQSDQNQYGIHVEQVGIRRIELPEQVTNAVFTRMINENEALAASTRKEGEGRASGIKSEAEAMRDRIIAFAERYADELRTQGDREAAQYHAVFGEDPEFAQFMVKMNALPQMIGPQTTIFLPPSFIESLQPDLNALRTQQPQSRQDADVEAAPAVLLPQN